MPRTILKAEAQFWTNVLGDADQARAIVERIVALDDIVFDTTPIEELIPDGAEFDAWLEHIAGGPIPEIGDE